MNRFTLNMACICGIMSLAGTGWAGSVDIPSPDKAHTYAASRISNTTLKWSNRDQKLYANITFDPQMYAGDGDSGRQEYFVFGIPGVTFDPQANTFYAKDNEGEPVAVAIIQATALVRAHLAARGLSDIFPTLAGDEAGEVFAMVTVVLATLQSELVTALG